MVENVLTGIITSHQHNYLPINGGNLTGLLTIFNQAVWYAGNSNKTDVNWAAKGLTLNGDISGVVEVIASSYALHNSPTNPYLKLALNGLNWYVQLYQDKLYLGYGLSNSMSVDSYGNAQVKGNLVADGALVAKYLSSTFTTDYPIGSATVLGTFKAGLSLIANAGTLDQRTRHYTTTTAYTDAAARDITAKIPIGTGTIANTETISIQLPFLPSSTSRGVTANILVNPSTWDGSGLTVTLLDNGTNYVAFVSNFTGSSITKDGINLSISAKQTV